MMGRLVSTSLVINIVTGWPVIHFPWVCIYLALDSFSANNQDEDLGKTNLVWCLFIHLADKLAYIPK